MPHVLHCAGIPPSVQKYANNPHSCCRLWAWTQHTQGPGLRSGASSFPPEGQLSLLQLSFLMLSLLQQPPTLHPQQQPTFYHLNSCVSSFLPPQQPGLSSLFLYHQMHLPTSTCEQAPCLFPPLALQQLGRHELRRASVATLGRAKAKIG